MKKLLTLILILMASPAWSANQWQNGDGSGVFLGTTKINDIDTNGKNYAFDPLDRLMSNYRVGQVLTYASASTLTVTAGEIVVTDGVLSKLMLQNAASTTVTWTDIDTGTEAVSTTYYVYAVAATSASTAVTYKISLSSSVPTGVTYYKRIGSFYNNADGNIANISNDNDVKKFGTAQSKTAGATYQATTDGYVVGFANCSGSGASIGDYLLYSDGVSTPTTLVAADSCQYSNTNNYGNIAYFVKSGDYYKTTTNNHGQPSATFTLNFIPIN